MSNIKQIEVAVLIFDGVDLMDFTGPVEVFNAVREDGKKPKNVEDLYNSVSKFNITYISFYDKDVITTADGTRILPDISSSEVDNLDKYRILVVPGGKGIHEIRKDQEFVKWLTMAIDQSFVTLSVCTGAYACAMTGFLDDEIVATHWRHLDFFSQEFPEIKLANNARYMDGTNVVTTGGVSAGIDGALFLVKYLIGQKAAQDAANLINYTWMG